MMKKHLVKGLLVAVALVCPSWVWGYDFSAENEGNTIFYTIISETERTCRVTYKDRSYESYSGDVVIPASVKYDNTTYTVTEIGNNAFRFCHTLTSITIPNTVTSIGEYAFFSCWKLKEVTIPDKVTQIETDAFGFCSDLEKVVIPTSVMSIGEEAFTNCSSLVSAPIPDSVTTIGDNAFYRCYVLDSITLPNGIISIGESAFESCRANVSLTIPETVTSIGNKAFSDWSLLETVNFNAIECTVVGSGSLYVFGSKASISNINIGEKVTVIPTYLLYTCTGFTTIDIPNSVEAIGNYAFSNSSLETIVLPNSVTTIGKNAFNSCNELSSVVLGSSVVSIGDYAFANTALETIVIPNSVTTIGLDAFDSCDYLASVVLGSSVVGIGDYAFWYCTNLSEVTSLNPEPPICGIYTFGNVDTDNCALYVPVGSKEKYSSADVWKDFFNIGEVDGIDGISVDGAEVTGIYTIGGMRVDGLQHGFNIVRYSDGTAKKVLVE